MKNFITVLTLMLAFTFVPEINAKKKANTTSLNSRPVNYRYWDKQFLCHRGFQGFPENTLVALEEAIFQGFTTVECDIAFSKDDIAVLQHDAKIDRCSNAQGLTTDYTLEQLQGFDFGAKKSEKFKGEKIATLKDVLLLCRRHNVMVELDCANKKRFPNTRYQQVYDLVKECNMLESTIFCDDAENLQTLIKIDPNVIVSISHCKGLDDVKKALPLANKVKAADFSFRFNLITREIIEFIHKQGFQVKLWTVDKLEDYKKFSVMGVDRMTSNVLGPKFDFKIGRIQHED